MPRISTTYFSSPLGWLKISASDEIICELLFQEEISESMVSETSSTALPDVLNECVKQLKEYFEGSRKEFDLPIQQNGTVFQQSVWKELLAIHYGETISYLQLARNLGNIKAIRAAASTNGKNKIAIVVPCHRVIGSNKQMVGYAGGISRKRWLLMHEAKCTHQVQTLFNGSKDHAR